MKKIKLLALTIGLLVGSLTSNAQDGSPSKIYIKIGRAEMVKKSLLALPPFLFFGNPARTRNYMKIGKTLFDVVKFDLDVSSYFTFIDKNAYLEDPSKKGLKPSGMEKNGFAFANWQKIGTDFLVRVGYKVIGKKIEVEAYLYHVPTAKLVFGKEYVGTASTVRKMAHTFSNDIVYYLTGKKGIFRTKFVVASNRDGNKFKEIYYMDWDTHASSIKSITNHKSIAISPAWSPDGKKIAYTAFAYHPKLKTRNADLFLYDIETGKRKALSLRRGTNSGATFFHQGDEILFTMTKNRAKPDIWRLNLNNSSLSQITNGPLSAMNVEPNISPDGTLIAFSSDRSGSPMIYTMKVNGSNPNRITFAGRYNASPSFSPDGKLIAFAGWDKEHFDIFVMNTNGTNMVRLTSSEKRGSHRLAHNEDPTFSPDGRHIAFISDRTGNKQLYIVNLDGTNERRLTFDRFNYEKPKWSPYLD